MERLAVVIDRIAESYVRRLAAVSADEFPLRLALVPVQGLDSPPVWDAATRATLDAAVRHVARQGPYVMERNNVDWLGRLLRSDSATAVRSTCPAVCAEYRRRLAERL